MDTPEEPRECLYCECKFMPDLSLDAPTWADWFCSPECSDLYFGDE